MVGRFSSSSEIEQSTNRDLEACIRENVFREDLYYRLNVVRIPVQPLWEHRSHIAPLAEHFLGFYSEKTALAPLGFSDAAILMHQKYSCPGNVRER